MFKKIRKKFFFLVSSITFASLFVIVFILNLSNHITTTNRLTDRCENILRIENPEHKEGEGDKKEVTPHYFIIENNDGIYTFSNTMAFPYSNDEFNSLAEKTFSSNNNKGYEGYLYFLKEDNKAVFIDARSEIESFNNTLIISSSVSFAAFAIISVSSLLFSRPILKPYEKLYDSERKFLTNASHELKTPLAIVMANLDVLSSNYPENQWVESSIEHSKRMKGLINEMVSLNKIEELSGTSKMEDFDIAIDLSEAAESYLSLAMKKNVSLNFDIPETYIYKGNEELVLRLFGILLDNACKYVNEDGYINISLKGDKKKTVIVFSNSVSTLNKEKLSHCFDRFYTFNESRNRQEGGYGIGLSIAKAIVNEHHSDIEAKSNKDGTEVSFIITFKNI